MNNIWFITDRPKADITVTHVGENNINCKNLTNFDVDELTHSMVNLGKKVSELWADIIFSGILAKKKLKVSSVIGK